MAKIHSAAIVEKGAVIGEGTNVWAFAHILPGAHIGANCNICDSVFIENDVIIGDRVTIKCGVQLWDGIRIESDVFIGPNATFTNDRFPRSKKYPDSFMTTTVLSGASIGANATILPGIVIGRNSMVGAGAVVTRDVSPNAIVVGNPAAIAGYVSTKEQAKLHAHKTVENSSEPSNQLGVEGCTLQELPLVPDMRGNLSVVEWEKQLPFIPKRMFWVFEVPSREVRGEHAHKEQHQYLICVKGSVSVMLDDGHNRSEVTLDRSNLGLYIPPKVWGVQYKYSADAVLLVLASDVYRTEDYIRDYDEFIALVKG